MLCPPAVSTSHGPRTDPAHVPVGAGGPGGGGGGGGSPRAGGEICQDFSTEASTTQIYRDKPVV